MADSWYRSLVCLNPLWFTDVALPSGPVTSRGTGTVDFPKTTHSSAMKYLKVLLPRRVKVEWFKDVGHLTVAPITGG